MGANLKKLVTVIVLAALVLAAFTLLPLPSVKADSSEAKVQSFSYFTEPSSGVLGNTGDIVVVGEIQNVGSHIIQNVTLGGTALDASGNTLATAEGYTFTYQTAPGDKAPFSIDFSPHSSTSSNTNWMGSLSSFKVTVLSVTDTPTSPYTGVVVPTEGGIPAVTAFNDSGVYEVVGTLQNNGTQSVSSVWVVTTFYDAAGTVVDLNFTSFLVPYPSALSSGQYTRWEATPADNTLQLTNEIASFSYAIDTTLANSNPNQTPTPTPKPTAAPSSFPTVPVIIVVVVVVAVVAALMLFRRSQKPAKTEESMMPPPPPPPPPTA